MTSRAFNKKLLSAVLVMALCISAVCGSIISTNAAAAGNTYSIAAESVAAGTKVTTATVTLNSTTGLTSGSFDLMFGSDVIDDVNFDSNGNYVTPTNETLEEFYARDKVDPVTGERNYMIAAVNYYKEVEVQEPVYDSEGNQTGTQTVTKTVVDTDKSYKENEGNKGTLLPNVYDGIVGLYDTKIEITGGVLTNGTVVDASDVGQYFTNSNYYDSFAKGENNTTNAIEGVGDDGRKYIYNMTDAYNTTSKSKVTYLTVAEGEGTKNVYKLDDALLDKYYREYTTVDVATKTLGYSISTVSEDSVGQTHSYAQYAQGFKDITFNSNAAFTSITFTVTFDFTGTCDRIGANGTVDANEVIGTTTVDGVEQKYRNRDGHWANENYVQYDKKYVLNFTGKNALSGHSAVQENPSTNFIHVHEGALEENKYGTLDPVNQAAIDALLAKNPEAREGVDYFELYNARCKKCGRVTPMIAAPDLPYKVYEIDENDKDVEVPANGRKGIFAFNNFRNISGANVSYEDDGSLSLNLHYPSTMEGEQMIITDENGMVMNYSDTIEVANDKTSVFTPTASSFAASKIKVDDKEIARYEGELPSSSQMITVKGLSAADVDKKLYVARYTPSSSTETQLMGITHAFSVSDYCNDIVQGAEYEQEDKLVAAALVNYSNASTIALGTAKPENPKVIPTEIDLLEFGDYLVNDLGSTSKWYDNNLADNGETGADWDNAIIIDSAEELVYLCKASGNDTDGKYYKVADSIAGFNLSTDKLDINGTLAGNSLASGKTNLDIVMGSGKNHAGGTPGFQGHFDGNGATVYGAWTNHTSISAYAGLFSCTKGDVTIKNINVNKAHFTATTAAGGVVGYYKGEGTNTNNTTLTIENCSVTDSYLEVTKTGYGYGVGAVVGRVDCPSSYKDTNDEDGDGNTTETLYVNNKVIVKNCYVNLDEDNFVSLNEGTSVAGQQVCHGGVVGVAGSNALDVNNCIVIGIKPYATSISNNNNAVQHSGLETHFTNVYTTSDVPVTGVYLGGTLTNRNFTNRIFPLSDEKLKGLNVADNMPNLNWSTVWCATEGYPTLYAPYNIPEPEPKTIYWDGETVTKISQGSGTKNDPYIINTAAELAWVVSRPIGNFADTDGKYFKVADGIKNIVLQPEEKAAAIMALSDAAAVKSHFENGSGFKQWKTGGWEGTTFCGNIDFNGVTIYGLYQNSANNAALICNVDAGAVIKNLTLKNSYLTKTNNNYQIGAIAAVANGTGYGKKTNGIIWFDSITIANNYIYSPWVETDGQNQRSGILMGAASNDAVYTDNCLIYGNDASWGPDYKTMPLMASAGNAVTNTAVVPEGLEVVYNGTNSSGAPLHACMVRNSIILGCNPYDVTQGLGSRFNDPTSYKNVYTDAQVGLIEEITMTIDGKVQYFNSNESQLKKISATEINGMDAREVMPQLDWYNALTNPDGAWHCSYFGAMPSLNSHDESFATEYPEYNDVKFITPDTDDNETCDYEYHSNGTMAFGVYQTALSTKANPYMSFAFAFLGEYKTNRENIKVTFTYTQNGETITTEPISVPAYNGEDIKNVSGWTNTKKNGRYHTYKATGLPISAMLTGIDVNVNYNGKDYYFGKFSIDGVGLELEAANAVQPCEYYETRIEAAKALKFYITMLQSRYGSNV